MQYAVVHMPQNGYMDNNDAVRHKPNFVPSAPKQEENPETLDQAMDHQTKEMPNYVAIASICMHQEE